MQIKGDKIVLRVAAERDADQILAWENDVRHWLVSNMVAPVSREEVVELLRTGMDVYASGQVRLMAETLDGQVVGCVDIFEFDPKNSRAGIGLLMDENQRGKGYAKESLRLVVDYCFSALSLRMLHADVLENNPASRKVFEACGFIESGVKKAWLWDGATYIDQVFYQRFRD